MPVYFNTLLLQTGIAVEDVILIRHQDKSATRGRTPYELWRDNPPAFEAYQRLQSIDNRAKFSRAPLWASFVGMPNGETLFAGLYAAKYGGLLSEDTPHPHKDGINLAGSCDCYDLQFDQRIAEFQGKLFLEWGVGKLAWVQRADKQNKPILELRREFSEPEFPGFLKFIRPLSEVESIPASWIAVLKEAKGVYLLTCPKTKELYVGSASGSEGFWSRWCQYIANNHGGNVALRNREYSDFQVSVLEVAGTASTTEEILEMEQRWMRKLQSREMGLNYRSNRSSLDLKTADAGSSNEASGGGQETRSAGGRIVEIEAERDDGRFEWADGDVEILKEGDGEALDLANLLRQVKEGLKG